ncbi:DNA-binding protein [Nocardia sp. NPDC059180]|uniref:DNA-binding protein n=1 Tax=Nocardia sp. NPDC059180 TaxID=3346761 RepID=UPI0036B6BCDB
MAHGKLNRPASNRQKTRQQGTMVLDCQGLSRLVDDSASVVALVAEGRARGMEVVISALTIIEATHRKVDRARLAWLLSGIRIEPVDETMAKAASARLIEAGLHGHKYAIDSVVAELAHGQPTPVVLLTSDPEGMHALCGPEIRIIPL